MRNLQGPKQYLLVTLSSAPHLIPFTMGITFFSLSCVFVCFLLFALLFLSALVSVFPVLCPKCLFSFLIKALSFYSISSSPLKLFSVCHFFSSLHASFFHSSHVCGYCSTHFHSSLEYNCHCHLHCHCHIPKFYVTTLVFLPR